MKSLSLEALKEELRGYYPKQSVTQLKPLYWKCCQSFNSFSAELRAELAAQLEREREMREHLEKQLNEEQKIRCKSLFDFWKKNSIFILISWNLSLLLWSVISKEVQKRAKI